MGIRSHFVYSAYLNKDHQYYDKIVKPVILQMLSDPDERTIIDGVNIKFDYLNNSVIINHFDDDNNTVFINTMVSYVDEIKNFIKFIDRYVDAPHIGSSVYLGFFGDQYELDENRIIRLIHKKKNKHYWTKVLKEEDE